MPKTKNVPMNMPEEFRYRIDSVRTETNGGYGEKRSLRNFYDMAQGRIQTLTPFMKASKRNKSLTADEVGKQLANEYESLIQLCEEAKIVLDDNDILGVDVYGREWWERHFDSPHPWSEKSNDN